MALDPDWITDMASVFADLIIGLYEELFALEGKPDGIFFYEDMGFKARPFMSPDMYRELIQPAHKKTCDWAHGLGLPVVMHSCGQVRSLLPGMIEAGIDCLQAMEVKAGMDVLEIFKTYGDKISLMGGLDTRFVANNDIPGIKAELELKIPVLKKGNGFIFHSDHSIPESTEYDTYKYFLDYGRKLGTY
jgi:uroporphyrinogen decarboxylase